LNAAFESAARILNAQSPLGLNDANISCKGEVVFETPLGWPTRPLRRFTCSIQPAEFFGKAKAEDEPCVWVAGIYFEILERKPKLFYSFAKILLVDFFVCQFAFGKTEAGQPALSGPKPSF
jgi:hypothetical protein